MLSAILKRLIAAGATAEMLVAAVEAQEQADNEACEERRRRDRERKRRSRGNRGNSVTPRDTADKKPDLAAATNSEAQPVVLSEGQLDVANSSQKERSPTPPKENTIYHSPDLFLVEESRGSESARARRNDRATRLPNDWMPTLDDLAFARSILPVAQVQIEVDSFRDHWHAANGPPSIKRSWSAAFRNWCRKAVNFAANGGGNGYRKDSNGSGGNTQGQSLATKAMRAFRAASAQRAAET
jgi:hypothetical protein